SRIAFAHQFKRSCARRPEQMPHGRHAPRGHVIRSTRRSVAGVRHAVLVASTRILAFARGPELGLLRFPNFPADTPVEPSFSQSHNAVDGAATGFTPGWLAGKTVQFRYHKPFFCRTPVADGQHVGSTSACEIGSDGTVDPRPATSPRCLA